MVMIRCCTLQRGSVDWNWKAYPRTRGGWANLGGGKKARDLKKATQLEDGQANEEPCLSPHR